MKVTWLIAMVASLVHADLDAEKYPPPQGGPHPYARKPRQPWLSSHQAPAVLTSFWAALNAP